ncbi:endolytic transglycosylase MltG [Peribacillus faecalis]|nr:endolytic transglycosylase MltG [Peribacillus faecalis]
MSRDSIRGFAAGLLFAAIVIGGFYYFIEKNSQQDLKLEDLKQASIEMGYELVEKESTNKEAINQETTPKKEETQTITPSESETYQFQIPTGMGSDDISRLLFENNIIEDADQFEIYLKDHDLAKKIQIGTYQLHKGMTFEEISDTITK